MTADTHGDMSAFSHKKIRSLKADENLFILGDFGFLWENSEKEHKELRKIGLRRHRTFFIPGANDDLSLYRDIPEEDMFGGRARCIYGNLFLLSPGVYSFEGRKLLICGTPNADDADKTEDLVTDELLLNAMEVDMVLTHEPPASIGAFLKGTETSASMGYFFDTVRQKLKFSAWYFGMLHMNKIIPPKYHAVFDEPVEI
ncbi:MAG: hypothetical protein IJ251_05010 [Oscillospiraceae bacterium]|nr:hypothetical protein [Oscillospiraceae bacterium]